MEETQVCHTIGEYDLVIVIEGGCLRAVYAKDPALSNYRVTLRDLDNIDQGDEDPLGPGVDLGLAADAVCIW